MKIATKDLTDRALNHAVHIALGLGFRVDDKYGAMYFWPSTTSATPGTTYWDNHAHDYCGDWAHGGPIIERERIKVAPNLNGTWHGQIRHEEDRPLVAHKVLAGWTNQHGPTPLVAAMRCFVASRLGDGVDVPEELA